MARLRGTQRINQRGHLEVGGVDACELAERFGTPLYVVDEALVRQRMREYREELGSRWPEGVRVAFAGKAFLCTAMCRIAEQEGLWLDLSSGGELYTALKAGFPPQRVYFHGNCKTPEELEMALSNGVGRVVVDNFDEMEMLEGMASERGSKVDILLRITPGVEAHTHEYTKAGQIDTKFGFQIHAGQAMEGIRRALNKPHLSLLGLHCHIGSQLLSLEAFEAAIEAMAALMLRAKEELGWEAEELNLGGGLGIAYLSGEEAPSVGRLAEVITSALRREISKSGLPEPVLALEPGRSIVGEAGTTLYRVWAVKEVPGVRTFVMVDGGMSDNPRVSLYGAKYEALLANKANQKPSKFVAIAGKHCEKDMLIEEVLLPEVEVGDIVAVPCTGAYHYSMASNYNRYPRPAVVLVWEGCADVIVERETYEDIVAKDRVPERLERRKMRVIVGHVNGDFDSVAATYAASKLYTGAVRVLPRTLDPKVREFLRLYGEALDFQPPEAIDLQRVTLLVVVDTQVPRRIGPFSKLVETPGVEVHLYDHHPEGREVIQASRSEVRGVGSTTTILVGHMRRKDIRLEPWEATFLALGIYWDTGCLTFRSTTPEDLEEASWLLKQGANLDMVHEFAQRPLEAEQRVYLDRLAEAARYLDLDGLVVLLSAITTSQRVEGLGKICERLCDEEGVDAAFVLVGARGGVAISARAKTDAIDLGGLLSRFGGGGHRRAASAVMKRGRAAEVAEEIEELLPQFLSPPVRAKDIMSSPVRTVSPETSVEDALKVMLRYGHSGLIVVRGEEVVGIVTRGDLDKARRLGQGSHPVSEYMSTQVISVPPEAPLDRIRRAMVEGDVGRLPVMERGRLVGIVTRTDVLRAMHGMKRPLPQGPPDVPTVEDVRAQLRLRLPPKVYLRLREAGEVAHSRGMRAFAVGGFVRDLLLGLKNFDLDIAVEGEAIEVAEECAKRWGGEVFSHERFGTAKVKLPSGEGVVDFATCRAEFYQKPAVLPQVERASIREDLYRRDFTINAMAICLFPQEFGRLWDYFGGLGDLRGRRIRVLHNLSFVEDPTRILRAVRYEKRLSFRMEKQTERLLRQAVEQGLLSLVSADRIRNEILRALSEPSLARTMGRLDELGVLREIHPPWSLGREGVERLKKVPRAMAWFERETGRRLEKPYLVPLCASIQGILPSEREGLLKVLRFPSPQQEEVLRATDVAEQLLLRREEFSQAKPSKVYQWLGGLSYEGLAYLASILTSPTERARIRRFVKEWREKKPLLTGEDLKSLGLPPGPLFARILRQVFLAQIDGKVSSKEEALSMAERIYRTEGE